MPTASSTLRLRRHRPLLAVVAALLLIALASVVGASGLSIPGDRSSKGRSPSCATTAADPAASTPAPAEPASTRDEGTETSQALVGAAAADDDSPRAAAREAAREDDASTGLDLEVRIGRIRIEFPWLKALPISPGRHVVLELIPPRS